MKAHSEYWSCVMNWSQLVELVLLWGRTNTGSHYRGFPWKKTKNKTYPLHVNLVIKAN